MKYKIILGGFLLVAVGVLAAFSITAGTEVEVVEIQKGELVKTVEETGYVEAADFYEIQASLNGKVVEVSVECGDKVEKGQVLAVLENLDMDIQMEEIKSQLKGAEAELNVGEIALESTALELEQAEKDLERKEKLFKAGAVSQAEYEQAVLAVTNLEQAFAKQEAYLQNIRAQLNSLENIYQEINSQRRQLVVTSPIKGTVLFLPIEEGQMAFAGAVIAQVGDPERLEVKADILSDDLAEIREGQKVYIDAPVLGEKNLTGKVKKIYPQAYEKTSALGIVQRRVPVIIALDEVGNLQPGYEVQVVIETVVKPDVLLLPREAARLTGDGTYEAMLVVDGRVVHRQIKVGLKNQDFMQVVEGLQEGDQVVRDASIELAEGARVKVKK
ncbi:MAG: efflux RND transporter periplasmic adaptor subunit [Syntrophomonadaceae bacterium]|nr:efflux RND transporter periplasmic adaptor subunit [Syntrophomonadaceae bacterium]